MSKLLKLAKEYSQLNLPNDPALKLIAIQEYLQNESQEKIVESISTNGRILVTTPN